MEIFVHMIVSEDDVFKMPFFIRSPEFNDSSSEIGDGNFNAVFVSQKVEIGLLSVNCLLKIGSFQL
ncbi:hypothetical protein CQW34_00087 [Bacteroides fragilis]|uniref:Uncharacterized protein n=1 Tax=Bacteroides fragilis TaxID=817 RepID=A0A2M9VCW7_BACFG|nr:hypothetical protein CQW34_00087 [Bacteroides fragilis]PJY84104.1 hypothetical protein CQW33_00883 [Bacteroides fragilis]